MKYWKISNWLFSFGTCEYMKAETREEAVKQWTFYKEFDNTVWGEFDIVFPYEDFPNRFSLKVDNNSVANPLISFADIDEISEAEYVENVLL